MLTFLRMQKQNSGSSTINIFQIIPNRILVQDLRQLGDEDFVFPCLQINLNHPFYFCSVQEHGDSINRAYLCCQLDFCWCLGSMSSRLCHRALWRKVDVDTDWVFKFSRWYSICSVAFLCFRHIVCTASLKAKIALTATPTDACVRVVVVRLVWHGTSGFYDGHCQNNLDVEVKEVPTLEYDVCSRRFTVRQCQRRSRRQDGSPAKRNRIEWS